MVRPSPKGDKVSVGIALVNQFGALVEDENEPYIVNGEKIVAFMQIAKQNRPLAKGGNEDVNGERNTIQLVDVSMAYNNEIIKPSFGLKGTNAVVISSANNSDKSSVGVSIDANLTKNGSVGASLNLSSLLG